MHPIDTRQFSRVDRVRFLLLMRQPALRGLDGRQLAAGGRVQMRVRTFSLVGNPTGCQRHLVKVCVQRLKVTAW